MKSMILPAAVLLTSISLMAQNNGPQVVHANGTFAQAFAVIEGRSVSLSVFRAAGTPSQLGTFLFFDIIQLTPDGFIDTIAEGNIPNTAFHGNDPMHMVLDVDISQITNFISSTCTFTDINFTQTCGPGIDSGTIHLEWHQANIETVHTSTDTQQIFPQVRINSHEVSDFAITTLTGSFLGQDVTNGSGGAGTQHDSAISIELVK